MHETKMLWLVRWTFWDNKKNLYLNLDLGQKHDSDYIIWFVSVTLDPLDLVIWLALSTVRVITRVFEAFYV